MSFSKTYINKNKKNLIIISILKKRNRNRKRRNKKLISESEIKIKMKMKKKGNSFNNLLFKPNNTKTMLLLLLHSTDLVFKDQINLFKNNNRLILDKIHQF